MHEQMSEREESPDIGGEVVEPQSDGSWGADTGSESSGPSSPESSSTEGSRRQTRGHRGGTSSRSDWSAAASSGESDTASETPSDPGSGNVGSLQPEGAAGHSQGVSRYYTLVPGKRGILRGRDSGCHTEGWGVRIPLRLPGSSARGRADFAQFFGFEAPELAVECYDRACIAVHGRQEAPTNRPVAQYPDAQRRSGADLWEYLLHLCDQCRAQAAAVRSRRLGHTDKLLDPLSAEPPLLRLRQIRMRRKFPKVRRETLGKSLRWLSKPVSTWIIRGLIHCGECENCITESGPCLKAWPASDAKSAFVRSKNENCNLNLAKQHAKLFAAEERRRKANLPGPYVDLENNMEGVRMVNFHPYGERAAIKFKGSLVNHDYLEDLHEVDRLRQTGGSADLGGGRARQLEQERSGQTRGCRWCYSPMHSTLQCPLRVYAREELAWRPSRHRPKNNVYDYAPGTEEQEWLEDLEPHVQPAAAALAQAGLQRACLLAIPATSPPTREAQPLGFSPAALLATTEILREMGKCNL